MDKRILKKIISGFFNLFPIKNNKIIVDNFAGRGFSDNPKYIIEALHKESKKELDIVWVVGEKDWNTYFPSYVRKVSIDKHGFVSFLHYWFEYATSRVWIDNIKNFSKPYKRNGQFYLQTWHGAIALKKIEKAAIETLTHEYVASSKNDSKQIDLMISNSQWFNDDVYKNFWYDGEIAITGTPRNDVFFEDPQPIIKKVRSFYHLADDVEFILYAPTFRGHLSPENQLTLYNFDEQRIIDAFSNKYHKKFIVLKRLHPNIANLVQMTESDIVKDGSKYANMQDLLISCFALITDFSSSIFDLMLVNERIFLFAKDYENYVEKERGLNFDIKNELPFPFAEDENDLVSDIESFDEKRAKTLINDFKAKLQLKEDGHASERVAKIILNEINEK